MQKLGFLAVGTMAALAWIALAAVILMVLGAVAGLVAGWVFPQVFDTMAMAAFGKSVPPWQIGAMLGFVGGFLRPRTYKKSK